MSNLIGQMEIMQLALIGHAREARKVGKINLSKKTERLMKSRKSKHYNPTLRSAH